MKTVPGHSLGHNYRYTVKKDSQLKTDWFDKALCKGTSTALFFHDDRREPEQTKAAKDVCKVCPVCKECLKYAMEAPMEFGIWGGLTPRERWRLERANRRRFSAAGDSG